MKTLHLTIVVILIFSYGLNFLNAEAKCTTDANGNVIENCSLPSSVSPSSVTSNQSHRNVNVSMVVYLLGIVTVVYGGMLVS